MPNTVKKYLAQIPLGRLGNVQEVAEIACFMLSDSAQIYHRTSNSAGRRTGDVKDKGERIKAKVRTNQLDLLSPLRLYPLSFKNLYPLRRCLCDTKKKLDKSQKPVERGENLQDGNACFAGLFDYFDRVFDRGFAVSVLG